MKENVIRQKSFQFAVDIVYLHKHIQRDNKEYILSKQLVRSGTSIGACVREALNAETKPDFIHKFGIAQKECGETEYWLALLQATDYITFDQMDEMLNKNEEFMRLIRSIIITSKKNLNKE